MYLQDRVEMMLLKGYSVYPVIRPVSGKKVSVCTLDLDNSWLDIGEGLSYEHGFYGICILINNTTINSNRKVIWKYID